MPVIHSPAAQRLSIMLPPGTMDELLAEILRALARPGGVYEIGLTVQVREKQVMEAHVRPPAVHLRKRA